MKVFVLWWETSLGSWSFFTWAGMMQKRMWEGSCLPLTLFDPWPFNNQFAPQCELDFFQHSMQWFSVKLLCFFFSLVFEVPNGQHFSAAHLNALNQNSVMTFFWISPYASAETVCPTKVMGSLTNRVSSHSCPGAGPKQGGFSNRYIENQRHPEWFLWKLTSSGY